MEIQILNWINDNLHGSGFINQIFKYITYLGEKGIAWALVGIVLLCFKRTRKSGLLVLGGYCAVVLFNHIILKNIVDRARPFTESEHLVDFIKSIGMSLPDSSSFPSGHTAISITCATILTMCFGKRGAWSFIPAVLISLSRIFLCVHYPTDVLAGATEGVMLGVVVVFLGKRILNWLEKQYLARKKNKGSSEANSMETNTKDEEVFAKDEIADANPLPEKAESGITENITKVKMPEQKELILKPELENESKLDGEQEKLDEHIAKLTEDNKTKKK